MKNKGVTLISLIITIVILIILSVIVVNLALGKNGLFKEAKNAKKTYETAEIKEKMGTEILAAQIEAISKNEELNEEKIDEIITNNKGKLQADRDTIILENGNKISLSEIYNKSKNEELSTDYIDGYNYGRANAELTYIGQKLVQDVNSTTVTFPVNKGTKYYVEALYICSSSDGCGHNNSIMNISNADLVKNINQIQHYGYEKVYAGRYNSTFKATDSSVDIYIQPHSIETMVKFNIIITLYSIS